MPPQQGEVALLTLFSDVHYYLSPPAHVPVHHRFDKSSYVYLYHNPMRQNGRIEIANNAGTPSQDAFAGQLETVKIEQSYKHPCLFTLTVDAFRGQSGSPAASPQQDTSQWHLPAYDPTNQSKYLYRLHTVDLYFWTPEDANMFLDSVRRVVQPHQLQIVRNPNASPTHLEHKSDTLSPVIARLESAAISHSSRSPSISTTTSFPGPPTAPAPSSSSLDGQQGNYAPMAYNPAAPAAPEPIAHREKTPPPPDAADGTGLGNALQDHQPPQYGNPLQTSFAPQPTSGPYMPGPPAPPAYAPPPTGQYDGHTSPPPAAPGLHRATTMPVQQYANYPGSPGFPPAPQSPPMKSPGMPPHHESSPPVGGYSQYVYGSTAAQRQAQMSSNDPRNVHQQLWRPNEYESTIHGHHAPGEHAPNSNIGKRVEKVEKGIGSLLKKLDKKF